MADKQLVADSAVLLDIYKKAALLKANDERARKVILSGQIAMVYYSYRGQEIIPSVMGNVLRDGNAMRARLLLHVHFDQFTQRHGFLCADHFGIEMKQFIRLGNEVDVYCKRIRVFHLFQKIFMFFDQIDRAACCVTIGVIKTHFIL